jgi:glutamate synthase (NADPH/NADH) large chain
VPADVPASRGKQDHLLDKALDVKLIERCKPAIENGEKVRIMEVARNVNRSVGAMLSGAVTKHHAEGLPTTPSASTSKARAASPSVPSCATASR